MASLVLIRFSHLRIGFSIDLCDIWEPIDESSKDFGDVWEPINESPEDFFWRHSEILDDKSNKEFGVRNFIAVTNALNQK